METVYLALGANIGETRANIDHTIKLLNQKLMNLRAAPIYTSKAVGYTDQPDFLNTAVVAETDLSLQELMRFIKDTEQKVGRIKRFRWGPREIDIDIILYGDQIYQDDSLEIPHPRFRERDFVLKPLCDLNPQAVDPVTGKSVRKLLQELPGGSDNIIT